MTQETRDTLKLKFSTVGKTVVGLQRARKRASGIETHRGVINKSDYAVVHRIYEHVRTKDGFVNKASCLNRLYKLGVLEDDPRIASFIKDLRGYQAEIARDDFLHSALNCKDVLDKAITDSNVITNFEQFIDNTAEMFNDCMSNVSGTLYDKIPQLANKYPDHFGLSVCSVDGQRFNIGDTNVDFSLQGCVKPISYCLALEEHGLNTVHAHVGREPSGQGFNALKVNNQGLPHNPLIESGALMISSLIQRSMAPSDRFDYIMQKWSDLSGGKSVGFDNAMYLSQHNTSSRSQALCYFMRENGAFPQGVDIKDALDFYFQCCAMTLDTNTLAIIAGTLANGGVCPVTEKRVLKSETVKYCLSMMFSCGMYDYSGEFAFKIGLPAKSGLSGVIFIVIPGVMGLCTYSPRLDKYGNSSRGLDFFWEFTKRYNFHMFESIIMPDLSKEDPRSQRRKEEQLTTEKIVRLSSLGDIAALRRFKPTVSELVQSDYDRRTPLHLAASNGHYDVVQYIIDIVGEEERNINPVDRWGATPYDDARRENHFLVAEYLQLYGGESRSKRE